MNSPEAKPESGQYQVVALKYRPQTFTDLIGQDHIASALSNAIKQNRVGHAYLFTGARGVGKTSSARIFAKCLNCETGPTSSPCGDCDICQTVSVGEDVDVLEIDGASNRGIDEIRQLRSNAAVRPSRSRYKIYIIDEVHMLSVNAFNALLKTLEEPPKHVKFIFATTEIRKVPVTVLSRCQRFDLRRIEPEVMVALLRRIATAEGAEISDDALALITWVAFGASVMSKAIGYFTWEVFIYALLSLTLIRMLPVFLSLFGTGLHGDEKLFMGWFGPRGLASIVFAVIVLNEQLPGGGTIVITAVCTIVLSVLAHGLSANPLVALLLAKVWGGTGAGSRD